MSHNKAELVPELRQLFQNILTDGSWTITEAEALELLYLTSPNLLMFAIKAVKKHTTRKHIVLQPDETLAMLKRFIGQANADREASVSTKKVTPRKSEQELQREEEALMFEGRND